MGFLNRVLVKMAEIRSVVNTSSRYFQVLFYDLKYICFTPVMIFLSCCVLKMAVANKWLNGTTEAVEEIKHHAER